MIISFTSRALTPPILFIYVTVVELSDFIKIDIFEYFLIKVVVVVVVVVVYLEYIQNYIVTHTVICNQIFTQGFIPK